MSTPQSDRPLPVPVWHTTASREVYANAWISVSEHDVVRPDGAAGIYGVVTVRNPAVFVVAVDATGCVVLIDLERYTTGRGWEVPAGGSDGEDLLLAAQRELAEETGLRAGEWQALGTLWSLNGVARAQCRVYLATDVGEGSGAMPGAASAEGIGAVRRVPWPEVASMCRDGRIADGESVAALGLAAIALGWWR